MLIIFPHFFSPNHQFGFGLHFSAEPDNDNFIFDAFLGLGHMNGARHFYLRRKYKKGFENHLIFLFN